MEMEQRQYGTLKTIPNAGMRGIWKKEADRLRPPDIKDEDVERIINEGRDAYAQGKLSEWITQTFGSLCRR